MKIVNLSIQYRTTVLVLLAVLLIGGLRAYKVLPKESNPSIEIPNIVVTTVYPGASPSDVENLITQVIEQELQTINGIDEIRSTSVEGVSSIVVEFTPDVDLDEANQRVRDKVDLAKADLPEEVEEPLVSEIDLSEFPIMNVNLAANYPLAELKEVAEELEEEIEAIPSVLEVDLVGGLEREVQVNVDLDALQGYGLAFADVIDTIREENTNIPGGSIDVDRMNYLVRVDGQFDEPREIEDLVVTTVGQNPVFVRDLAEVRFGFKDVESFARLRVLRRESDEGELVEVGQTDYKPVISLNVKKRSGENIIDVSDRVKELIATFPVPSGTQVVVTGDQSKDVRKLVKDLENNIISGLIFVVAVLLFFLGVRTSVLVGIAIPFSMFTSFIVFQAMGQTLNFIILFSLIIALGMLVDNAVVIVENIYRFREEGYERWEAARLATGEVGGAVVASTATTIAAFVPMLFWPGIIGEFMSYMPLTLIVTLSSSLFVALVINPVVTGYFVRVDSDPRSEATWATKMVGLGVVAVTALLIGLVSPISLAVLTFTALLLWLVHTYFLSRVADRLIKQGLPSLVSSYRGFLSWMLQRDYSQRHALWRNATALVSFAAGFGLLVMAGAATSLGNGPGLVFGIPGGVLLGVGLVGIVLHTGEVLLLGARTSVKVGLIIGAVVAGILGLMFLSPRSLDVFTAAKLMVAPAVIVLLGVVGILFVGGRSQLILTDNRAKLMNTVLGTLVAIMGLFALAPTGVEFFPETDPNQIKVVASGPTGQNVETTNRVVMQVQERLQALFESSKRTEENVKNLVVNVGVGGDSQFGGGADSAQDGTITLNLIDFEERSEKSSVALDRVRDRLQGIAGVDLKFEKDEQGPPTGPPVNIEISGPSFEEIVRISEEVKSRLRAGVGSGELTGLVDIRDNLDAGRPELQVDIDRERAARFGLSTQKIAATLRTAIQGEEASTWRTGEDEYDITVRLKEKDRSTLDSLRDLTILNEGQQIPLVAVANLEVASGLGSITRLDLERVVTVEGDAATGVNAQALLARVKDYLKDYQQSLPMGYGMEYTGENEDQQESFSFLGTALTIGLALITMILIAQFNSLTGPLLIMIAVGLSLIGVQLGLILTRTPFGLMTFIGLISLAGIVVNNNIVLVDYMQQLRAQGMEKEKAIVEAGATRLRPVLLTALTTVLGLVPLTFGINVDFVGYIESFDPNFNLGSANTQFWGPMGTAIISGLTFATFLTLVIMPVMYSLMDSFAGRAQGWFMGVKAPPTEMQPASEGI